MNNNMSIDTNKLWNVDGSLGNDDVVSYADDNATMNNMENNMPTNRILVLAQLFDSVKAQIDAIYGSADWFTMQNELYCIQRDVEECRTFAAKLVSEVQHA